LQGGTIQRKLFQTFPPDVPNIKDLSMDVLMNIRLKDEIKPMAAHAYLCQKKYCEGWKILIQQHLATGHIRPSNSDYVPPAFIVLKVDLTVLPHWVTTTKNST
jgi:hypothetical protein